MPFEIPPECEPRPDQIPDWATDSERFRICFALTRKVAQWDDPKFCKELYFGDIETGDMIVDPSVTPESAASSVQVPGVDHRTYFANEFRLSPPRVIDIAPGVTVQGGVSGGDTLYLEVVDPDRFGHENATLTLGQRDKLGSLGFTEENNCVMRVPAGDDPAGLAGEILAQVVAEVFGVPPDATLPYEPD